MFQFDRFIFIGPAAAVAQQAIETVNAGGSSDATSRIVYKVDAKRVQASDIADFTLLASQHDGNVTLSIQNESLRVDTTTPDRQKSVVLDDGTPVGSIGIANEDLEAEADNPYIGMLKSVAEQYGVEVEETSEPGKLVMESLTMLEESESVEVVKEYPSGSVILQNRNDNGIVDNLYYVQCSPTVELDQSMPEDIQALRAGTDAPVVALFNNQSDTPEVINDLASRFVELDNSQAYIVNTAQAEQSLSLGQESMRSVWHIRVPKVTRFVKG